MSRVFWYGFAVFLSSACLLVLEIVAGRVIAPYVGVSLYTWTSIIGVILAGLSLGNWAGGVWADRGGGEQAAGVTLALGGLFCLASLLILTFVAPAIQASDMNIIGASFLFVLSLFFVPAVLLGVITPLLTTLALGLDARAGHVVGRMHALAAVGSIAGTFATGYWLVQTIGTRNIIIGTGVVLFVLSLPFFAASRRGLPVLAMVAALALSAVTAVREGFREPCLRESSYFCIRVVDYTDQVPFGTARALILDHLLHGINHESEPAMLVAPYVHLMDELAVAHFGEARAQNLHYFFAGGGSYTQPRAVDALYRAASVTVAELDPAVTETAVRELYVDPRGMRVVHQDARVALSRLDDRYDVVVTDVFHDVSVPHHLVTREFAELVHARLVEGGLYTLNIVDVFPDPRLVKAVMKTLATRFAHVDAWMDQLPAEPTRMTYVISATDGPRPPAQIQARRGFERTWLRVTEPLLKAGTPPAALPVLSDDFAPVEGLISELLLGKNT